MRIEILYLKTGLEGSDQECKVSFGFAFRRYYFTCWLRIRGKPKIVGGDVMIKCIKKNDGIYILPLGESIWRHFVLGWSREQGKFKFGISR